MQMDEEAISTIFQQIAIGCASTSSAHDHVAYGGFAGKTTFSEDGSEQGEPIFGGCFRIASIEDVGFHIKIFGRNVVMLLAGRGRCPLAEGARNGSCVF